MGKPGKKKPVSILKRERQAAPSQNSEDAPRKKRRTAGGGAPQPPQSAAHPFRHTLRPTSDIHRQAAHAIGRLLKSDATGRNGASLKSLTLAPHITNKKAVYAVTIETMKALPVLEQLVERSNVMETAGVSKPDAYVLTRELLWGGGMGGGEEAGLKPTGPAERAVLALEAPLRDILAAMLKEAGAAEVEEMLPATQAAKAAAARPRTARVNELKMSVEEAMAWLRDPPTQHSKKWLHLASSVAVDPHLPEVLVFPPGTDLHDHPLVASGALIQQSKASCMTARALAPQPGKWKKVIDACAAPGNKTTHLAALLNGKSADGWRSSDGVSSSVIAFDRDAARLERLRLNAAAAGAGNIIDARCADFLLVDPDSPEFADVAAVLLDPSCSGSGTAFSRMDHLLPSAAAALTPEAAILHQDPRVLALAEFQTTALKHALRFPAAQRVAYSTCSLHEVENEGVVAAVLKDARALGFELVPALPQWERRGVEGALSGGDAAKVVRTHPLEDGTDGFFVALFERLRDDKDKKKEKKDKKKRIIFCE